MCHKINPSKIQCVLGFNFFFKFPLVKSSETFTADRTLTEIGVTKADYLLFANNYVVFAMKFH